MADKLPRQLEWLRYAFVDLALAKTVQDFKSIHDRAESARAQLHRLGFALDFRIHAAEISAIAMRKAGLEISKLKLGRGGRPGKNRSSLITSLQELKISKNESSHWQRIARIPEEEFWKYLDECSKAGVEVTRQGLLRLEKRLRTGGATSEPAKPRGGKRKRGARSAAPEVEARKPDARKNLRDELLKPEDVHRHRARLKDLLIRVCGEPPLAPLDESLLGAIAQLSRELWEYMHGHRPPTTDEEPEQGGWGSETKR